PPRLAAWASGLLGDGEPALAAAPPVRRRREPAWPPARAEALRARWCAFVQQALDLPGWREAAE
ncbi:MAG TPA: hypothetical protein VF121_18395, partial [Thermoanaerobaculia bacterium]|nr:hypothetical protein [Thermoanaerobaculia bacterium]